jgi:transcriptional regulator with XRE-family HTH domain
MSNHQDFGAFFRARRKALGLSLAEFCRRHQFDKGNISRLERGLVPPPRDQKLLESYAKILKLDDANDKRTFFDLADASRLKDPEVSQKLPELLRQMRVQGQGHTSWVKALDLESWAKTLVARSTLPQLVRRLVRATGRKLGLVEFPAHEQVQRTGWDGIVEAHEASEFVPAGISGWEMGVDQDPRKKAQADYRNRSKSPGGLVKKKTTFVFVTPRKWQDKHKWRSAKTGLKEWKGVRVYDSASLEEWLEQAPAIDAWLAGLLEKRPEGVILIDEYWENLRSVTKPSLVPEVFLASREKAVKEFGEWLDGPPGALVIDAQSPTEAIDFVAAFSREPSRADWFAARALIVENRKAWRDLASSDAALLLIAHPSFLDIEPELVAEALRKGHRVLLPSGLAPRERASILRLPRVYRYDLEKVLVSLEVKEAARNARNAGGSITVLKRLLGRLPGTTQPEWSQSSGARSLVPMVLAGSWDEASDADRSAMAKLAGHPYEVISEVAERWRNVPDPPLIRIGSRWSLVSRIDSWNLLGPVVTRADLDRFRLVVKEVLAEEDPTYQAPPAQRLLARLRHDAPRYSPSLRAGLAETLAILGTRPGRLNDLPDLRAWSFVPDRIVTDLLKNGDWIRWASIAEELPLLAEAAPGPFLEVVERDITRPESALVKLLEQASNEPFALNRHIWLLSALEGLAWSSQYLSRVSQILAALDERTSREATGNSAFRSLLYVFLPWLPQTTASVEQRIKALGKLVRVHPEAAWRLLIGLLPNQQPMWADIRQPLWRDWAVGWTARTSPITEWQQLVESARLLFERLGDDLGRWIELIEHVQDLPDPAQAEFLDRLNGLAERLNDEERRRKVADAIRERVSLHRRFSEADWALPEDDLSALEEIQRRFEPDNPVQRNAWLFQSIWQLPESVTHGEERLMEMRRSAVREVYDCRGWASVVELAEAANAPDPVGTALAQVDAITGDERVLPALLTLPCDNKMAVFAQGYLRKRFHDEGWSWIDRMRMDDWSTEQVARLLLWSNLPFERRTWEYAASKGDDVAARYWQGAEPRYLPQGRTIDEVTYEVTHAVEMLLKYQGPAAAAFVLMMAMPRKEAIASKLFMDVLEAGERQPAQMRNVVYMIPRLIEELQVRQKQGDPTVDLHRLARLEWIYLDLLDGHPVSAQTFRNLLRDKPEYFVELLSLIYRPRHASEDAIQECSEEEKRRAGKAYQLLLSWKDVPGSRDDGTVDELMLFDWIKAARSLARERGLLEVCDSRIGEVLAYAPSESDGSWPCIPVRDALEEISLDSEEILSGFSAGIFNKRGLITRSLREGGDQERDLARTFRAFADACQGEWDRTAETLRRLARSYEEDARREDERLVLD